MIQKRGILLLSILFFISSYFMVKFQNIKSFSFISSVFIIFLALPSYYYLVNHLGFRRGFYVLLILSILPVIIEGAAVRTGFPYGEFEYSKSLGLLIFDLVPPSVSFAYLPILLGGLYIASVLTVKRYSFSLITSSFIMLVDLVIDPAAVSFGFWNYNNGGLYYGVPLSNFIGWLITGFIYAMIFYILSGKEFFPLPSGISISLIWILSFWIGYLLIVNLYIPSVIGIIIFIYLLQKIS